MLSAPPVLQLFMYIRQGKPIYLLWRLTNYYFLMLLNDSDFEVLFIFLFAYVFHVSTLFRKLSATLWNMYIRYIPYSYIPIHIGGHSYSDYTKGGVHELGFKTVLHFNLWSHQKLDVKTWIQITFFKRIIFLLQCCCCVDKVCLFLCRREIIFYTLLAINAKNTWQ